MNVLLKSCVLGLISFLGLGSSVLSQEWSSFRGPQSSGVFEGADLPDSWNGTTGENIQWKTPIPGIGMSSPVIWGNRLFVTTAVSVDDDAGLKPGLYGDVTPVQDTSVHEWRVFCLDTESGEVLWNQLAARGVPSQKRHPMSSHANASMATDGVYAVAFFGSEGLYAWDMDGNLQWKKDFGLLRSVFFADESAEWEWAGSPIIYEGKVIIQVDVMDQSFVAALDVKTGEEIWRTNRVEDPTWCTPNVYAYEGEKRVVLNGFKERAAYDLETGERIWHMSGGGDIPIPTPIIGNDYVYFNSAHGRLRPVIAVKKSARGDISLREGESSNEYVAWILPRNGAYMASMVYYNDLLFVGYWNCNLACINALTGEVIYNKPLARGKSYAGSPVVADGKLYFGSDEGKVFVIQADQTGELLAELDLGEGSMVTPAIKKGQIFYRTLSGIMAIGK